MNPRWYRRAARCVTLIAALILTACVGGPGPARYYLMAPAETTQVADADSGLAIQIIDLILPQYLDRLYIVKRNTDNRLSFSESHQWGENLRKTLLRNLLVNLSASLNTAHIGTPLVRSTQPPDYQLLVMLTQFELSPDNEVVLRARWQLSHAPDGSPVATHSIRLAEAAPAGDYDAMVAVMSRVFTRLCDQIAATVPQPGTPPGTEPGPEAAG